MLADLLVGIEIACRQAYIVAAITYHPNLLVNQVTHENDMIETWANDPNALRRPGSIAATGPAAAWSPGTYVYDGTGDITRSAPPGTPTTRSTASPPETSTPIRWERVWEPCRATPTIRSET